MDAPFPGCLTDVAQLADHYRAPSKLVQNKKVAVIDDATRAFIEASPFVLVGTADATGRCDVSPRGGDPGFVRVLDDRRLVLPDLNGNNLVDTLRNVVANPQVGMLFVIPGRDETLRLDGRAWVSVDADLRASFTTIRTPASVLCVEVESAFIHCAKSFRRGHVWDTDSWAGLVAPTALELLACHLSLDEPIDPDAMERGYAADLAADRPE
jgi:hypothetical protein